VFVQVKPDNLENLRPVLHPHKFCQQRNEDDSATSPGNVFGKSKNKGEHPNQALVAYRMSQAGRGHPTHIRCMVQ
jgi:hypothetical protein